MQDAHQYLPSFFISSDIADRLWARWIAWQLLAANYLTVLPEWHFPPGSNSILETQNALRNQKHIIIVLSPDYLKILSTEPTWAAALFQDPSGQERKLLPVRVRERNPQGLLGPIIPIDLIDLDEPSARATLLAGVGQRRTPPTAPIFPGGVQRAIAKQPRFPRSRPAIWNVPPYNPFFIDREGMLEQLYEALKHGEAGLVHPQVINGLGGIGKTQIAVAYAYLHSHSYEAVLWVNASEHQTLVSDVAHLAGLLKLNLSRADKQNPQKLITALKQWLEDHSNWLLIIDNIEDPNIVKDFIPQVGNGHVLLTAQTQATGTITSSCRLVELAPEYGALFLLRRAKIIGKDATLDDATAIQLTEALKISLTLGNLPLALEQAGAYIEETAVGMACYLNSYKRFRSEFLGARGDFALDHSEPVATTWSHAFEKVRQADPAAYELLIFCSFLYPDAIPEEIITTGTFEFGPAFQQLANNPLKKDRAIAELRKYSLLDRDAVTRTLSMHPLVQAVLQDQMSTLAQRQWAERAVLAVYRTFLDSYTPASDSHMWQHTQRYFPHVHTCAFLIEKWDMAFKEAAHLLYHMSDRLQTHVSTSQAESLIRKLLSTRRIREEMQFEEPHVTNVLEKYTFLLQKIHQGGEITDLKPHADTLKAPSPDHPHA